MEEQQTAIPQSQQPQNQKKSLKKPLLVLLALVLAGAVGYGVYVWQQTKLTESNVKLKDATSKLAQLSKESETSTETKTVSSGVKYTAKVGKFSITVPERYAVVSEIDGAGEGGEATILNIVDKTDNSGVFTDSNLNGFSVTAYPMAGSTYSKLVNDTLYPASTQLEYTKSPTKLVVSGVNAEDYTLTNGQYESRHIFFTKNGIFYYVELAQTNTETATKLDSFVKGFKFN